MTLYRFLALSLLISSSYQQQYICDSTASCGCSPKLSTLATIIRGETETRRDWAWVVRISTTDVPTCGGSILSSSWILTAASCVIQLNISEITILAGSNNFERGTQQRRVATIIMHPSFNKSSFVNDIALIRLETPLDMADSALAKICLPARTVETYPPENSTLVTIGWNAPAKNIETSKLLRQIVVKTISEDDTKCQPLISDSTGQVCAAVDGLQQDTCYGDSGNPLMIYTSSRQWTVVGIVSYGMGCTGEYATIYTRVTAYLDWINSVTVIDTDNVETNQ